MRDPRRLVLDGPWDFLSAADKEEVLRVTGPWDDVAEGLSMGGCLRRPAGFDVVVTLDRRITRTDDLAPESSVEHLPWDITDGAWPDVGELVSLTTTIHDRLAEGKQVLVRCMAGLNRSGLVCAAVLVRQGTSPDDAIRTVRAARSRHALCNPRFVQLITRMLPGDPTLGLTDAETGSVTMRRTSSSPESYGAAAEAQLSSPNMDVLMGDEIAAAKLTDWRKLAQGLHARYLVDDFATGARFVTAVGEAGDALGHHPSVSIGSGYVDLKLVTADAIYRDDDGTEYVIEWVTQQDVDLARRITEIAAEHEVAADPASVSVIELGLDTAHSAIIAPVWAALLTGNAEAQGHGSPSDEIRDPAGRVPNLWFGDADEHETPRQRFHVEVYVAPEVAEQRIAAVVAAGGTVVDDSDAPSLTVIADQDGNRGVLCVAESPATTA